MMNHPTYLSIFALISLLSSEVSTAFTLVPISLQTHKDQNGRLPSSLLSSSKDNKTLNEPREIDVSDLELSLDDLDTVIPPSALSVEASGYQSTSRIPSVDDQGCYFTESADDIDVTLQIPGLRGQPAAALSVLFSTTTVSVTAFGMVVWSCIQRGKSVPEESSFLAEEGEDMVPIIQLHIRKSKTDKNKNEGETNRWEGFILQVGEDSIL